MKTNSARILLFSVIAMLSIFLLGSTSHSQVDNNNNSKQLEKIALDFRDIPHANRAAWNNAASCDPKLLIRLSTSKLVGINNISSISK